MPNLDIMINGDCASAVAALSATERAIGGVQSKAGSGVTAAVSVAGARVAVKDLNAVTTAIGGATAASVAFRSGGPIAGGLGAGAVAARGLASSLGGTTRALSEARAGAGALATAVGRIGATAVRGGALAGVLPVGGSGSIVAAATAVNTLRASLAAQQLQSARGLPVMAMASAETRALAGNATAAAGAMTRLGTAAAPIPVRSLGYLGNLREGIREGMLQGLGGDAERAPGTGRPPPPVPIPPRGGGGGGGGGAGGDEERRAAAAGKASAEIVKGLGTMVTAGLAVGVATNAAYAKHALDAVNVTISETPVLAGKAKDAADELGNGIRDITAGTNMDGFADSFERLGTANRALGQMQGQIGRQNLATKLETEAASADTQTRALGRMAPAFDAAIRGSSNLADALLTGISDPQVVNGVRALGESLSKPEIAKGLSDITTGAAASSLVFAKLATDVTGAVSSVVNSVAGGQNVTDMSGALFGGGAVAALAKGGLGAKLGAGILGGSAILGSQQLMAQGRDDLVTPSLINEILGAAIGYRLGGAGGMVVGGLGAQYGTQALANLPGDWGKMAPSALTGAGIGATIGMVGGPVGMAIGAGVGAAAGAAVGRYDPNRAPGSATNLITGQDMNVNDPSNSLGGQLGLAPVQLGDAPAPGSGGLLDMTDAQATGKPGETNFFTGRPVSGPGSIGGALTYPNQGPVQPGSHQPDAPKSQAAQLQDRQQVMMDRVGQEQRERRQQSFEREARAGTGYPAGAPLPSVSAAPAAAAQQLDQSAQQATQSVVGLGQAMPQVAQQVQALPAAFAPVQQLPTQANAQMKTAASIIQSSASQVGETIPPAISTGIVRQTPQVCDATANMGASMVNCAARALLSASPSKKFVALGESTGDGAKIGVDSSAGGAVDAVGGMVSGMLGQVGALGSGVTAASDGAVPMAESGGLMVGYVWARSVQTGVDSVLRTSDFAAASMPAINSALAKTTLGKLGLLGVAGSGASISKTAGGGIITMGAPAPVVNATFQVSVDGTPLQVISQRQIDGAMDALADSFSRQRG